MIRMISSLRKGLAYFSLASALLLPMRSQSQTWDFHVGNVLKKSHYSEQGESLPNIEIILKNLNSNDILARLNTNNNGRASYYPNGIEVKYEIISLEDVKKFMVFDVHGGLAMSRDNFFMNDLNNLPSGPYVYSLITGNSNYTGKFIKIEDDLQGLNLPATRNISKSPKNTISTDEIISLEILIRDESTDEIGSFYDFKDTLDVNLNNDLSFYQDLIPVWEIEPDTIMGNYRNNLHQIKHMTQTDFERYGDETLFYLRKWYSYPVSAFFNRQDDQGYNVQALEYAINEWENSTRYEDYYSLDVVTESREIPEAGILMDYTTMRASGTAIADAWFTHIINGQRFYSPRHITVYIGNTLGREYEYAVGDTRHELGHAIMASRAHSPNQTHVMTGGGIWEPALSEGKTLRYIVLEKPFARTWNYLEE